MSTKRKRGGGRGELKEEDPLELKLYSEPWVVKKMSTKRKRGEGRGALAEEEVSLELKLYSAPWVVKKRLMASDLGHLSRVILPGIQVEKHVLPSLNRDQLEKMSGRRGLELNVLDSDTGTKRLLSFKKWRSNGSYKLGLNWVSEFVKRRQLRVGDEIGMVWVNCIGGFCFSVTGRAAPPLPLPLPAAGVAAPNPSLCEFARKCLRLCPPMPQDMIM